MHTSIRKLLAMMLVLSLAIFLAAGCGDDEEGNSGADDDEAQEEGSDEEAMEDDDAAMEEPEGNILETAAAAGNFTTLASAVEAAGLTETLSGEGPFTVFAPSDDAFADPSTQETLQTLMQPENQQQLQGILTYHVIEGEMTADMLEDGATLQTVAGAPIMVSVGEDGTVTLNADSQNPATVTQADIMATNGVIHQIDAVLLPPAAPAGDPAAAGDEAAGDA